jgi:hypothetical protein
LTNKIHEGIAKGHPADRIEAVVRQMTMQLELADRLIREVDPSSTPTARESSVILLAEAVAGGVTETEIRDINQVAQKAGTPVRSPEVLASAAKALSFIKSAELPASQGTEVVVAAVRSAYPPHEIVDLGRQVKRREADYRSGRESLGALRDAIARGDAPDRLFRDARPPSADRPASTRPAPPARPETPPRPERSVRPERPLP